MCRHEETGGTCHACSSGEPGIETARRPYMDWAGRRPTDAPGKAATRRIRDGLPVHSFATLLDDLSTLTLNTVRVAGKRRGNTNPRNREWSNVTAAARHRRLASSAHKSSLGSRISGCLWGGICARHLGNLSRLSRPFRRQTAVRARETVPATGSGSRESEILLIP